MSLSLALYAGVPSIGILHGLVTDKLSGGSDSVSAFLLLRIALPALLGLLAAFCLDRLLII